MDKKNIIKNIGFWIISIIIIAAIAYIIEAKVLNNVNVDDSKIEEINIEHLYTEGFELVNGELVSKEDAKYASIVIPNDGEYIQYLLLEHECSSLIPITLLDCKDKVESDKQINEALENSADFSGTILDSRTDESNVIVDGTKNNIIILFNGINDHVIIKSIKINNLYYFHYSRYMLMVLTLISLLFLFKFRKLINVKMEIATFVIIMLMGSAMLFSTPYEKNSWDDETHYKYALESSYQMLGEETMVDLASEKFVNLKYPIIYSYPDRVELAEQMNKDGNIIVDNDQKVKIGINNVDYLPTALGMQVGRLINLDFINMFVLARFFNLLMYAALLYFTVKITPIGKELFTFMALLPTPMFLTTTYNTDYYINGLMMLATALFLKEYYSDEKVGKKSFIAFLAVVVLACIRKIIYFPFIFLYLLIPKERYESSKQKRNFVIATIVIASLEFVPLLFTASGMTDIRMEGASVTGQIEFILNNPIQFAMYFVTFIARNIFDFIFGPEAKLNFNLYGMIGESVNIVVIVYTTYLIIMAKASDIKYKIKLKDSMIIEMILLLIFCFICGSMYLCFTPVGASTIEGVQARYLQPIICLAVLAIPFSNVYIRKHKSHLKLATLMLSVSIIAWSVMQLLILK